MSRFIKIGADGAQLSADATGHVAVLDTTTNLMWSAANIGDEEITWNAAKEACAALDLAGFTDWQLPTVEELFALADRSRYNPAIDTNFFPDTKSDWYWSSTVHASSSDYAWIVYFNDGNSNYCLQDYNAFVRAVRRAVPAGQ